jgi:hypothetical protein
MIRGTTTGIRYWPLSLVGRYPAPSIGGNTSSMDRLKIAKIILHRLNRKEMLKFRKLLVQGNR